MNVYNIELLFLYTNPNEILVLQRRGVKLINNILSFMMQDHGGVIVNISATLHYRGSILQAHAASAKAAIGRLLINIYCFVNCKAFDCYNSFF